ncbi:MAG: GxxExxY protein [Saprospiraceae bacterium]|nr:GxxExxY protein [Saprospiraceae bacterium]
MKVHGELGPGLLESTYEACLAHEFAKASIPYSRQLVVPLRYDGVTINDGYRLDLLVDDSLVVELKTVEQILPIHEAQLLTYLRLGRWPLGLILNFNSVALRRGIRRMILD